MHLGDPGDPPRAPRPAARLLLVGLAAALRPSAISGLTLEHATRHVGGIELFLSRRHNRLAENYTRGRLRERPDPHALPPAPLAVGYLCVPADAQFIKALMRGLLPAIWAKAAEPFGTVTQMNCAASGKVRH